MEGDKEKYVLINPQTGKAIALDKYSGGYPYDVDDLTQAKIWDTEEEARRYKKAMASSNFVLRKLVMREDLSIRLKEEGNKNKT